jgi:hypothetical protein
MISCWSCIEVNKWISTGTGEIDTGVCFTEEEYIQGNGHAD